MKVAICGYPPLAQEIQHELKDIDFKFFIEDFISDRGDDAEFVNELPTITFFEFRRMVDADELDGVFIAEDGRNRFTRSVVRVCQLYNVKQIGIMDLRLITPFSQCFWLEPEKPYLTQLEANLIDGCNLNCKGCAHFSSLFKTNEIYPLETFRRDLKQIGQCCTVVAFYLLGGEPLLLKNLDEYIKIARQYLPRTNLHLVTNGLLIPSLPKNFFDVVRENNVVIEISNYPPTYRIIDKIQAVLDEAKIFYVIRGLAENKIFNVFITLHAGNDATKARYFCCNNDCRFLRDGKIYKCPVDALSYKFTEHFGIENFPQATGVDIFSKNFPLLLDMLNGEVELCNWCSEEVRKIPWAVAHNPKLEDWLADPDELKNF